MINDFERKEFSEISDSSDYLIPTAVVRTIYGRGLTSLLNFHSN
ncbi:hypothetical protein HMPREF3226_02082 [Prevotella corporis]|uniref:Uncharacterized protein n=1 Tax=Prevotella corporis TaxID=28128 RepID=A0A133PYT0_9BACT|nr:hypothetical protein HMPREF3226_02082 [Prevotella corporis]